MAANELFTRRETIDAARNYMLPACNTDPALRHIDDAVVMLQCAAYARDVGKLEAMRQALQNALDDVAQALGAV